MTRLHGKATLQTEEASRVFILFTNCSMVVKKGSTLYDDYNSKLIEVLTSQEQIRNYSSNVNYIGNIILFLQLC